MVRTLPFAMAASLVLLTPAAAAESSAKRPDVSAMSIKDIRLHNEGLESTDPYFISCKRYTVTGSLAKKERICLTKEDWDARADRAQDWTSEQTERSLRTPCPESVCF